MSSSLADVSSQQHNWWRRVVLGMIATIAVMILPGKAAIVACPSTAGISVVNISSSNETWELVDCTPTFNNASLIIDIACNVVNISIVIRGGTLAPQVVATSLCELYNVRISLDGVRHTSNASTSVIVNGPIIRGLNISVTNCSITWSVDADGLLSCPNVSGSHVSVHIVNCHQLTSYSNFIQFGVATGVLTATLNNVDIDISSSSVVLMWPTFSIAMNRQIGFIRGAEFASLSHWGIYVRSSRIVTSKVADNSSGVAALCTNGGLSSSGVYLPYNNAYDSLQLVIDNVSWDVYGDSAHVLSILYDNAPTQGVNIHISNSTVAIYSYCRDLGREAGELQKAASVLRFGTVSLINSRITISATAVAFHWIPTMNNSLTQQQATSTSARASNSYDVLLFAQSNVSNCVISIMNTTLHTSLTALVAPIVLSGFPIGAAMQLMITSLVNNAGNMTGTTVDVMDSVVTLVQCTAILTASADVGVVAAGLFVVANTGQLGSGTAIHVSNATVVGQQLLQMQLAGRIPTDLPSAVLVGLVGSVSMFSVAIQLQKSLENFQGILASQFGVLACQQATVAVSGGDVMLPSSSSSGSVASNNATSTALIASRVLLSTQVWHTNVSIVALMTLSSAPPILNGAQVNNTRTTATPIVSFVLDTSVAATNITISGGIVLLQEDLLVETPLPPLVVAANVGLDKTVVTSSDSLCAFQEFNVSTTSLTGAHRNYDGDVVFLRGSKFAHLELMNSTVLLQRVVMQSGYAAIVGNTSWTSVQGASTHVVIECASVLWDGAMIDTRKAIVLADDANRSPQGQQQEISSLVIAHGGYPLSVPYSCYEATSTPTIIPEPPKSRVPPLAIAAVVITFVASIGSPAGTSVGPLIDMQRALGSLRLGLRCNDGEDAAPPVSSDAADNPFHAILPEGVPESLAFAAGAVLGNLGLAVIIVAASHGLALLRKIHEQRQSKIINAADRGCLPIAIDVALSIVPNALLPGAVITGYAVVLQPALSSAMALIVSDERTGGTIALGVCGLFVWIIPGVLLWAGVCVYSAPIPMHVVTNRFAMASPLQKRKGSKQQKESLDTPPRDKSQTEQDATTCCEVATRVLEWAVASRRSWVGIRGQPWRRFHERFGVLLEPFDRPCYFAAELVSAAAGGMVLGAASVVNGACETALWGVIILIGISVLEIGMLVWYQTHVVRSDAWAAVAVSALSILAEVLVLSGLEDDEVEGPTTTSGTVLSYVPMILAAALGFVLGHKALKAWFRLRSVIDRPPTTTSAAPELFPPMKVQHQALLQRRALKNLIELAAASAALGDTKCLSASLFLRRSAATTSGNSMAAWETTLPSMRDPDRGWRHKSIRYGN